MSVLMDFGKLAPEINSGRIYSGPGSGPLLTAAEAWRQLATELRSAAASYNSVISGLATDGWRGPASSGMTAAAAPYVAWMNTTAGQAEQAADQATTAAGAYESARASSVPPPVIAANRTQLASLVATNILGQNTPAIAATEAHYGAMWAQDAAAMYGYAGSSATATTVTPFTAPQQNTNPGGLAGQAASVAQATATSAGTNTQATLSQLTSDIPTALQNLGSGGLSTGSAQSGLTGLLLGGSSGNSALDNFWNEWGPDANIWNTIFSSGFYTPGNTLGAFTSLIGAAPGAGAAELGEAASGSLGAGLGGSVAAPLGGVSGVGGGLSGIGGGVSAGVSQASSIGPVSVPPTWTAAVPTASPVGSALGGTPLAAPAAVPSALPGIAPTGAGARATGHLSLPDTRFLDRPPMVPSWSAAG